MLNLVNLFSKVDQLLILLSRWVVITGMFALFTLVMIRIISRLLEIPFVAFDEIGELATVWMILFGVVGLWRQSSLYAVEFSIARDGRAALFVRFLIQLTMLVFAIILVWQGGKFTAMNLEKSAFLLINMDYYYGAIPVTGALMVMYSLRSTFISIVDLMRGEMSMSDPNELNSNHL